VAGFWRARRFGRFPALVVAVRRTVLGGRAHVEWCSTEDDLPWPNMTTPKCGLELTARCCSTLPLDDVGHRVTVDSVCDCGGGVLIRGIIGANRTGGAGALPG